MVSFKVIGFYLLVSVFAIMHLFPCSVLCEDEEQNLLHDINTYRKILSLPILEEHKKMSCLAEKIAEDLDNNKNNCQDFHNYYPAPGTNNKFPNFQEDVKKCKININTTKDGVIMPVYVHKLDNDALFSNYTKSNRFTKFLNDSKYTVAGVGSEDDWLVLILSTNKTSYGDFSSSHATSVLFGVPYYWMFLMLFFNVIY